MHVCRLVLRLHLWLTYISKVKYLSALHHHLCLHTLTYIHTYIHTYMWMDVLAAWLAQDGAIKGLVPVAKQPSLLLPEEVERSAVRIQ